MKESAASEARVHRAVAKAQPTRCPLASLGREDGWRRNFNQDRVQQSSSARACREGRGWHQDMGSYQEPSCGGARVSTAPTLCPSPAHTQCQHELSTRQLETRRQGFHPPSRPVCKGLARQQESEDQGQYVHTIP